MAAGNYGIMTNKKADLHEFIFQELIFSPDADNFSDDGDLIEAGLDSMAIMRLVIFIEERFGVTLPDNEVEPENIQTIRALEQWILRNK